MAVKYSEIKAELENAPFTNNELSTIAKVEAYIDKEIKVKFDGRDIHFDTKVFEFNFNPDNPQQYHWDAFKDIKNTRKELMSKELKRRYEDAGWKIKREEGEDDGPNRPAIPYYVLKGK